MNSEELRKHLLVGIVVAVVCMGLITISLITIDDTVTIISEKTAIITHQYERMNKTLDRIADSLEGHKDPNTPEKGGTPQ